MAWGGAMMGMIGNLLEMQGNLQAAHQLTRTDRFNADAADRMAAQRAQEGTSAVVANDIATRKALATETTAAAQAGGVSGDQGGFLLDDAQLAELSKLNITYGTQNDVLSLKSQAAALRVDAKNANKSRRAIALTGLFSGGASALQGFGAVSNARNQQQLQQDRLNYYRSPPTGGGVGGGAGSSDGGIAFHSMFDNTGATVPRLAN